MPLFFPQLDHLPLERYVNYLGPEQMQQILRRVLQLNARLHGRVVWNVSSSYVGGGVAEMVRSLLAYARGSGVDARWAILHGNPEFFTITKRLHNALHGSAGDGSPLGPSEHEIYQRATGTCAAELAPQVNSGDIAIVHDPQPLGIVTALRRRGAHVIWRCHIGSDHENEQTALGWAFLAPYLNDASAYVFSRPAYAPPRLDTRRVFTLPPSIDPFSAKNQSLADATIRSILVRAGILTGSTAGAPPTFIREDGSAGHVVRHADVLCQVGPIAFETPLVVQVSRWDRLKDAIGVLRGFAQSTSPAVQGSHLILAGPNTRSVADDPEDAIVCREVAEAWRALPLEAQARISLVALPTVDVDENAAIVNALQRHAAVIVQKSLHEGFGLTVTEALWKSRPVIASAVGGIQDQITDGVQGLLLKDPSNLAAFGELLERLLTDAELSKQLGEQGHARVLDRYLGVHSLLKYGDLIERLDQRAIDTLSSTG